jgi:hypothetical protein
MFLRWGKCSDLLNVAYIPGVRPQGCYIRLSVAVPDRASNLMPFEYEAKVVGDFCLRLSSSFQRKMYRNDQ